MINKISGRVVVTESGAGVADLLVVVYDVDPTTKPEEDLPGSTDALPSGVEGGDRLGSVLTRSDGTFSLSYEDSDFRIRNEQEGRPDLQLMVLAPEEPGVVPEAAPLYLAKAIRQNAGRNEECLIRLSGDQLRKGGITPPSTLLHDAEPTDAVLGRLGQVSVRTAALIDGNVADARKLVEAHQIRFAGFASQIRPALLEALSGVPTRLLQPERFVAAGESPADKNVATIQQGIRDVINSTDPTRRAPRRGYISLTREQADQLQSQAGGDGSLPLSAVTASPVGGAPTPRTALARVAPTSLCMPQTVAQRSCVDALDSPPPSPTPATPPPVVAGPGVTTADDIPKFIARLMEPLAAPEEQLITDLMPVATRDSVQSSVRTLDFEPSPADVPSYHEFSNLQVAFQHVWQEAIDQHVLDLAQDAYETIVELGGDPTRPDYQGVHPIKALQLEGSLALRAVRATAAPVVRDHRGGDPSTATAPGGIVVSGGPVRDHRKQDGALASPDPAVRLPALLVELQEKLRQKYAFTVFAANEHERSINFGILNAFWQTWTPLSYQAGPLVKSIPLAPRQSQKIVISRKVNRKRATKEVENNLRVLKEETSQTNRAEQEITSRAETKTELAFQNESSVPETNKTTSSFKQDAAKSASDAKKSFHEAVFKAAQEFKNERTTEVTTEEVFSEEYTETTEISNPNDEIAVTFLFYELQRRYRLHESLNRVSPVVLVAQEFPAPQDLDEAWLLAQDWILKRAILDDSFLPTLNTLSESAGNETAINEMALNITQQRAIVASLNQELAVARQNEATQRNLIQGAVVHRSSGGLLGALGGLAEDVVSAAENVIMGPQADESANNKQALQDSADRAADTVRDVLFRLEREVTALNALLESYTKALRAHHTHLTEVARLLLHVKSNIFYYMQAIWMHEPPDQRYFRLHNVAIPTLKPVDERIVIDFARPLDAAPTTLPHRSLPRFGAIPSRLAYPVEHVRSMSDQFETVPLCELANIHELRGFLGNYMIFALDESNPLTDFMMAPYLDQATGELLDPSDPTRWSADEFAEYICCLREHLTVEEFESLRPQLKAHYEAILASPNRTNDVLVVPTNSLFIEALPAEHSLIERYKRDHRMIDVKDAQAKVREKELDNVRRAARLLAGEREDPSIDQRVLIEGQPSGIVVPMPPEH